MKLSEMTYDEFDAHVAAEAPHLLDALAESMGLEDLAPEEPSYWGEMVGEEEQIEPISWRAAAGGILLSEADLAP
jgi:hypothetical protein